MSEPGLVLDALGDPTRRRLLQLLAERSHSVGELADRVPVTRPAVSHHLRVLKNARLVKVEAQGNRRVYRLDQGGLDDVRNFVGEVWGNALARFKLAADSLGSPAGE